MAKIWSALRDRLRGYWSRIRGQREVAVAPLADEDRKIINVWLALRDDAQAAIKTRLTWDESTQGPYTGPVNDRAARIFELMHDRAVVENLFRTATLSGRVWTCWSLYFNETGDVLQKAKVELDWLAVTYPQQAIIAGAWNWNTGAVIPQYPVHPRALDFLPDINIYDANGNITGTVRPTNLSGANILFGQAPRSMV